MLVGSQTGNKIMEPFNILLIGGSGRSGTTILSKIMSMHPNISNVPEFRYLIDPDGIIDFYNSAGEWSPYQYDLKLKRLEALLKDVARTDFISNMIAYGTYVFRNFSWKLRPRYWGVSVSDYCPNFKNNVDELIHNLTDFSFNGNWIGMSGNKPKAMRYSAPRNKEHLARILGDFLRKNFWQINQRQNVQNYLEKNTWNHIWFDKILELLPEAKLVHIYRDPRDVVSSFCNQPWMPSDPVQCATILRDLILKWDKIKNRVPQNSIHEIALEQLVSQPKKTLGEICDFYGIPWSNELLRINLSKSNRGRWEKHFAPEQAKKVYEVLGEQIERFGYA